MVEIINAPNILYSMKQILIIFIFVCAAFANTVLVLDCDGAIDPPMSQYIVSGLARAHSTNAELVIIIIDTPGGLMSATKEITDAIVNSDVPVAAFVYPRGARAASAGVFITMASHIAAMSPGTHIGAAHPVGIGVGADTSQVMMEKSTNDAIAWLRSLAQLHGRNEQWAERAVRYSESITASEAESIGVIDLVAQDIESLLHKISGTTVKLHNGEKAPNTENAEIARLGMTVPQKVLHTILNPNIAYLLLIIGLVGLYLEFQHPGAILPGVAGVVSLLAAIYAFQILPVNYIGVLLIFAGIVMFILEVKMPGFGLLTGGGIVALLLGSFMLTSGNIPILRISWWTIIPTVLVVALLFIFVVAKALVIQRKKPATGIEGIVGEIGEVIAPISADAKGKVYVHGEIWDARAPYAIEKSASVRVARAEGMTLWVEKA